MSINAISNQSPASEYLEEARDALGGDAETQVAAMMLEHVRESRQVSRAQRQHEEAHLRSSEAAQVQAMHDEADAIRMAGYVQGGSQIAGGVLTAAAAGQGGSSAAYMKAGAETSKGVGEAVGSHYSGKAADLRADATAHAHRAEASAQRLEDLREANAGLRDLRNAALDNARQIAQTRAATEQAALFQRV
jgi:hypothetical protein